MLGFRAWYADSATYDGSVVDDFKAMPYEGVVVICVRKETGRTILDGGDWYFWRDGDIGYVPSVEWGRDEPRPDVACLDCVKRGVGVPDDVFARTVAEAWAWHGN